MLQEVGARAPAAETPPAEAPRPPVPLPPARQVAPIAVTLLLGVERDAPSRLTVSLEPGELGRVEVSVDRTGDVAAVQVAAERPETLLLLQRDARDLDRALSQAGLGEGGRSLSFTLADPGGGGQQAGAEGRQRRAGHAGGKPAEATPPRPPQRLLSLLDIAV
jgi:Meckel syndrome type 1 protein